MMKLEISRQQAEALIDLLELERESILHDISRGELAGWIRESLGAVTWEEEQERAQQKQARDGR